MVAHLPFYEVSREGGTMVFPARHTPSRWRVTLSTDRRISDYGGRPLTMLMDACECE
jgi:hypothetical protein